LIVKKWKEYGLDPSELVSCETIQTRVRCGTILVQRQGTPPILPEEVERVIADTVLAMQKMRQPLSILATIAFANSLVEGSEYQEKIKTMEK
jgi:hypothetical protein